MDQAIEVNTIGEALHQASLRLASCSDTPDLDAQVLLADALKKPRSWLLAHPEGFLKTESQDALERFLHRIEQGEPLPYVIGSWEFFGMTLEVTPDVLIPRPETELLVERAITWLKENQSRGKPIRMIDIGTGSGCIAITLAANVATIQVHAVDISSTALAVARKNAHRLLGPDRIEFVQADLFPIPNHPESMHKGNLPAQYDLVTANLPYIPTDTLHSLPVHKHEPLLALDGGLDGLRVISRFLEQAPGHLADGGLVLLQIEASQGSAVLAMAKTYFPRAFVDLHQDLSGRDRLLEIMNPPAEA